MTQKTRRPVPAKAKRRRLVTTGLILALTATAGCEASHSRVKPAEAGHPVSDFGQKRSVALSDRDKVDVTLVSMKKLVPAPSREHPTAPQSGRYTILTVKFTVTAGTAAPDPADFSIMAEGQTPADVHSGTGSPGSAYPQTDPRLGLPARKRLQAGQTVTGQIVMDADPSSDGYVVYDPSTRIKTPPTWSFSANTIAEENA